MTWNQITNRPYGFREAEAVLTCETHLIALWNHDRCRGWQLYQSRHPRNQSKTKWIAAAGGESVHWTAEQAVQWAEQQLGQ